VHDKDDLSAPTRRIEALPESWRGLPERTKLKTNRLADG
jgi:hypothetical protein